MNFPQKLKLGCAGIAVLMMSVAVSAAEIKLRLLQTTDLHMNLLNYDYYQDRETHNFGLAKTATLIKSARAEAQNSMLFDNGDLLQGSPLGDYVATIKPLKKGALHPAYKVMNPLDYDAANIGNHEFNFGLPFLRQAIAGADFPYVNANVFIAQQQNGRQTSNAKHAFTPYLILKRQFIDTNGKRQRLKIGVIGLVPPQIMQWDRKHLTGKVIARDMVQVAKQLIPKMRGEGAQLIVVIAHSGFEKTESGEFAENAVAQLAEIPGVDAILFGHAHAEFPSAAFADYPKVDSARGTINGVAAVMPGRWGDHLGLIDLTLSNQSGAWTVQTSFSSIRPIFDGVKKSPLVSADPMVAQAIAREHAGTLRYVRSKVAVSSAPIYSYFAQIADDPSVQLVANAQMAYVENAIQGTEYAKYPVLSAAAPFKTGGRQGSGYYTDIPAGQIAIKNVADLYVYPNTIKGVLLSGAEVREWIEMSAGQFNQIDPKGVGEQPLLNPAFLSFNFDTLDGVRYALDLTQPARYDEAGNLKNPQARRVVELQFAGKNMDERAKFIVATNNYRAYGGGNFPGLSAEKVVIDAPEENRQAVINYLTEQGTVDPSADGNWRILPVPGVSMRFVSSSAGAQYLNLHRNIEQIRDNGDGTALYRLLD